MDDYDDSTCPDCGMELGTGHRPEYNTYCGRCEDYLYEMRVEREIDEEIEKKSTEPGEPSQ